MPFKPEIKGFPVLFQIDMATFVQQWNNSFVFDRSTDGVNRADQAAEFFEAVLVFLSQRRTGKADVTTTGKHQPHLTG